MDGRLPPLRAVTADDETERTYVRPGVSVVPSLGGRPSTAADTQGLRAENLRKAFQHRLVLRDVSLNLRRGEAVGLLGPNGAGKTTCFHLIAGLLPLDAGRIVVDDADISGLPMYRRAKMGVGYLPQESSVFRGLSVEENVRAILELVEPDRHRRSQMLDELLGEFSLTHLRRAEAVSLSGGERRRLEIARCLASRPRYLLLDEPFAGVDPKAVGEMRTLVAHLKDHDIGVLITDHNARETFEIVDRVYVIDEGEVICEGSPSEVAADSVVRDRYLGTQFGAASVLELADSMQQDATGS